MHESQSLMRFPASSARSWSLRAMEVVLDLAAGSSQGIPGEELHGRVVAKAANGSAAEGSH